MTDLRVETVNINSLTPDPANARKHDGRNLKAIENSLVKFGQRKPICVTPDSIVVAGNGTLEAAKNLGWTEIAIARTPVGWTWEQIRAFAPADNRTAELAEWDDKVLADQLLELDANGWELEELGFENIQPPTIVEDETPLNFDDVPTRSKLGDLWQLGNHRLLCGDSTDKNSVAKLLGGNRTNITLQSPPYNANKNSHLNGVVNGFENKYQNSSDELSDDDFLQLLVKTTENAIEISDYCFVNLQLLTHNRKPLIRFQNHFVDYLKDILIWNKSTCPPNIVKGAFNTKWEYVFAFSNDNKTRGFPAQWQGKYSNVIETENNSKNENADTHKAGFPLAFPKWIIEKLDFVESVTDLFGGTGTTLIACEQLNKQCFTMELDPKYCDVIIKRWESYTGKTAELVEE
jgi:site-specific DNA-methyltransferase (adenine-specific)